MADDPLLYLRDVNDIEPPRDRYRHYEEEDIYRFVPKPLWTGMEEEIWSPRAQEHDPQLEKMKQMIKRNSQAASEAGTAMSALSGEPPWSRQLLLCHAHRHTG